MAYQTIQVSQEGGVLLLTLNRPPVNSLSGELIEELAKIAQNEIKNPEVRAIVITGGGEKAFCAGADLSGGFGGDDVDGFVKRGQSAFSAIENCGKPVIAAINGHALGGGCELAMSCHFRYMGPKGSIGLSESSLGIIPGYGGTQRLPRLVGRAKAIEMMVFGTRLSAQEALDAGLVDKLCDNPLAEAKDLAAKLCDRAPVATALIIDSVLRGLDTGLPGGLDIERANFVKVIATADASEGIKAFFEKRKADFKGK